MQKIERSEIRILKKETAYKFSFHLRDFSSAWEFVYSTGAWVSEILLMQSFYENIILYEEFYYFKFHSNYHDGTRN